MSDIINDLKKYLSDIQNKDSLFVAVYLFGSSLKGTTKKSDLDLAFLLNEKKYNADPIRAISPAYLISTQIGIKLGMETDVTILNAASLEIAYEIVTTGQCIYDFDTDKRLQYETTHRGMYFDFSPFLMDLRLKSINRL